MHTPSCALLSRNVTSTLGSTVRNVSGWFREHDWPIWRRLTNQLTKWRWHAVALLSGVLLGLAFPRVGIAGLAWIAPGLLLFAARRGNAFRLGYLAGFTHYLISLNWLLHIPVRFYPILGWIALAAYLALFPAAWAWLCRRVSLSQGGTGPGHWRGRTLFALFSATAWVAMEMIIARLFSGFPWNLLGASQLELLPLVQIASVTGIYGVAFLVVWFSVSLVNAFETFAADPSRRGTLLKEMALPVLVVAVLYAWGVQHIRRGNEHPPTRSLRIALIQPSIPQTMIWNPAEADTRFAELLRLTEAALTNKPEVVIWPEAAVPKMVRDDPPTQAAIARMAISNNVWFIFGSDDFDMRGTNEIYFNSSFLMSPRGELISTYRKRRLVIFGEYVPLVDWLPFIKYLTPITGGFTAGEAPVVFDLGKLNVRTSVLICFEDVFPHHARDHGAMDVDFLVNITNDGWFGESAAQWQHAASAAYRAVENGLPLVRCANNGLSCWIDRFGAMHAVYFDDSRSIYAPGVKVVDLPLIPRERQTFYGRFGDLFGWSCLAIAALAGLMVWRRREMPSVSRN